ncbi:MAG: myo-inositol 2-dehydrogenase / D-chiro-inositol 1-dehydrogenase [Nocardioidaceae bacterium]|nr:myo-inositol 2-dehydrogenase / D-chiro-inositol 1-dehydrogenase [Nocardioidaceae bacterium]
MHELRVGILGAGLIGSVHAAAYAATPGVKVVAVADPVAAKAARLATSAGAAAVTGLDGLLDRGLDIVSICTPSTSHAAATVRALGAGLHVLCEKPIARSLPDARLIVDAAARAPGILMIAHVTRFEPDHRQAKLVVESGQLGQVQMMTHSLTTSLPGWSEGGWISEIELSGGPLVDLAVHSFDYLSWLTGSQPVRVHAVGRDTGAGASTYAIAHVRYASGALALVETSWAHPVSQGFKLSAEFVGTDGRLSWDYDHIAGGFLHRVEGGTVRFDPLGDNGDRAEVQSFVEAVRSTGPTPVPAEDGLATLRTSLAALESVRTGTTIDLTTWELP